MANSDELQRQYLLWEASKWFTQDIDYRHHDVYDCYISSRELPLVVVEESHSTGFY